MQELWRCGMKSVKKDWTYDMGKLDRFQVALCILLLVYVLGAVFLTY